LQNESDKAIFANYRIVATVENYEILEQIHSTENGHVGYKKRLQRYSESFKCIWLWLIVFTGPKSL